MEDLLPGGFIYVASSEHKGRSECEQKPYLLLTNTEFQCSQVLGNVCVHCQMEVAMYRDATYPCCVDFRVKGYANADMEQISYRTILRPNIEPCLWYY